ncbi:hypothetical protein [Sneathiella glossodoripedis]|uniref:hypothetical protein n=1 Tax=Sneathiella glossodoripedis TaxID=418853 RepID=UPI000470952B|nr:hypothetical protein [Sneathiella glossodoripedis]
MLSELLSNATIDNVKRFFNQETEHRPSEETYIALKAIATTLSTMALGEATHKIHLSSLDPGSGKTVTITQFVKTLSAFSKDYPELDDVGVIVFLSRLEEIEKMVKEMSLAPSDFACITSDPEINELGLNAEGYGVARVIFTTQQMLESRLDGGSFENCKLFHFNDKVRQVRIWDESYLPGKGIVIQEFDLAQLVGVIGKCGHLRLSEEIRKLSDEVLSKEKGEVILLPEFHELINTSEHQLLADIQEHSVSRDDLCLVMSSLFFLSGKSVVIGSDGGRNGGVKIISYRETMPKDLAPLLVTDASGRVRYTYHLMKRDRGDILELPTSKKHYKNLTVCVWSRGGGKSSWIKHHSVLTAGIVETIKKEPERKWLIVHHLPKESGSASIPNIELEVSRQLPSDIKVSYTTWGKHAASNDFRECDRVVLAGTLFYPRSHSESLTRLCSNKAPNKGKPTSDDMGKLVLGESKHHILQAICRGKVRNSVFNDCGECKVFIIASAASGIRSALTMDRNQSYDSSYLFPFCTVEDWGAMQTMASKRLKGNLKAAYNHVKRWLCDVPKGSVLRLAELRSLVGAKDAQHFNKSMKSTDMIEALDRIGASLYIPNSRLTGITKV